MNVTAHDCVRLLNHMLDIDPEGTHKLFDHRVLVNKAIAEHPTIQVRSDAEGFHLGLLGLLNGVFSPASPGYIEAVMTDDLARIMCFRVRAQPVHDQLVLDLTGTESEAEQG